MTQAPHSHAGFVFPSAETVLHADPPAAWRCRDPGRIGPLLLSGSRQPASFPKLPSSIAPLVGSFQTLDSPSLPPEKHLCRLDFHARMTRSPCLLTGPALSAECQASNPTLCGSHLNLQICALPLSWELLKEGIFPQSLFLQ